jgi:hypothetical protein
MAARTAKMRHDTYTVEIDRRSVYVYHAADGRENGGVTLGEYDALIVSLIRMRDQYLLERMAVECTDTPDEEQPEWGNKYDTPAHTPAPKPVTYTIMWRSAGGVIGSDEEDLSFDDATTFVERRNRKYEFFNHWAEGTDGSIIGYVGAPK